jgi:hypothetical protein
MPAGPRWLAGVLTVSCRTRRLVSENVFESLFDINASASQAELRARVEEFERLKSAAAAGQARATALWADKRRAAEEAAGVRAATRGKGLASEIALARHDAPVRGNQHLGFAQALVHEMPYTLAALECGALSEWRATLIVKESACLSVEHRRQLDAELCAEVSRLGQQTGRGRGQEDRVPVGCGRGGGPQRESGRRPVCDVPPGAGRHDLCDRDVAGRPGGERVCGAQARSRHDVP